MSTVTVGGNAHDLNALFQTNPLQDLLKSLAAQARFACESLPEHTEAFTCAHSAWLR